MYVAGRNAVLNPSIGEHRNVRMQLQLNVGAEHITIPNLEAECIPITIRAYRCFSFGTIGR